MYFRNHRRGNVVWRSESAGGAGLPQSRIAAEAKREGGRDGRDARRRHLVLLVEDEFAVALPARAALHEDGLRTALATSLQEAFALASRETPAVALVNVNLGGRWDGLSLVRPLLDRGVKVIVCCAGSPAALRPGTLPPGIAGCLRRSISPDQLRAAVGAALAAA